jgi:hypothetical protein
VSRDPVGGGGETETVGGGGETETVGGGGETETAGGGGGGGETETAGGGGGGGGGGSSDDGGDRRVATTIPDMMPYTSTVQTETTVHVGVRLNTRGAVSVARGATRARGTLTFTVDSSTPGERVGARVDMWEVRLYL